MSGVPPKPIPRSIAKQKSRAADPEYFFGLEGPLDDPPGPGQLRAANLSGFVDFLGARSANPARILGRFGLKARALADREAHISCQQFTDLLEYCSNAFADPLFGLRLALFQGPEVYGAVTALCRAAPDLRAALHAFVDFIPVSHSPEAAVELVEGPSAAELRWAVRSDFGVNDQANLQALALNLELLRTLVGPAFEPTQITLAMKRRPRGLPEIEELLGHPAQLNAEHNAIAFQKTFLDEPLRSSDRLVFRLLSGYLGRLKIVNRTNTVERVQSYVRGALPMGNCAIERCAEQMGISVRTLQIRLASHGACYGDLVEAQREKLARIYLRQTRMALDEVAERLGYGEQTSFGRAFKRWTGVTPQRFRNMERVGS
jgi:AraC-like DNA-binding protein